MSVIPFISLQAKWFARESIYKQPEIEWCMEILYKHHKNKQNTIDSMKKLLIICANGDIESLYHLYKTFVDGGIIKPIDVRRKTFLDKIELPMSNGANANQAQ